MLDEEFDSIVIGAGPAGSSAAYNLAKKGFKVLLVEKGRFPGSKNMFGGRVYSKPLEEIYPNFIKEAPIQRWVTKERKSLVKDGESFSMNFDGKESTSFVCYLSELSDWMAKKAVNEGAKLITEITVDNLLLEDGCVKGIIVGDESIRSNVVIDAEGVNHLLLERAGIVKKLMPSDVAIGVKQTIKMSNQEIDMKFGLKEKEGLSWVLMGDITNGIPGGAFVYTNNGAVSIGSVLLLKQAVESINENVSRIAEGIRLHPIINKYVGDNSIIEYSAHLIPENMQVMAKQNIDGLMVVGDAGGFLLNLGYTYRGVDFSAYSGYLAAQAFEKAHGEGDYSNKLLGEYNLLLKKSFMVKQLNKFNKVTKIMESEKIVQRYPELINNLARNMFLLEYEAPTILEAMKKSRKNVSWLQLLRTAYKVVRNF